MNHQTITELLAAWDEGEPVWSIELGGMGPSYEQAIQLAAIEMARDNHAIALPEDKEAASAEWDRLCGETIRKHEVSLGGLSGAMFGAARWLAYQWCHNGGPERLQERAKEQNGRAILISRNFPYVERAESESDDAEVEVIHD